MKKFYPLKIFSWLVFVLGNSIGCHQEPLIPKSAIPQTCQLYKLINIDESIRDTTTYSYDNFGSLAKSTYRKWISNQLMSSIDQTFTYTADHYLSTQIDNIFLRTTSGNQTQETRGYQYNYQNGWVQEVKILNNASGVVLGFRQYTYEGEKLKTYTETNGGKAVITRYSFDGSGKVIKLEEPASTVNSIITNGKISQKAYSDSTYITYEYDSQDQLVKQNIYSSGGRSQYVYTYDSNPYWSKTQLRFRGIPSPDLGDPIQIHNIKGYTYQRYLNNKLLGEQKITYSHAYNKEGYSQGYGRSDGARQVCYYVNCP